MVFKVSLPHTLNTVAHMILHMNEMMCEINEITTTTTTQ